MACKVVEDHEEGIGMPRSEYYSDRVQGAPPRTEEEISQRVWGGIVQLIEARLKDRSFGAEFPRPCPRCSSDLETVGADADGFGHALRAEIPGIPWPLDPEEVPPTLRVLDVLEFCHDRIAAPREKQRPLIQSIPSMSGVLPDHPTHLRFDRGAGRALFREEVERILRRNGVAYELTESGDIQQIPPEVLREAMTVAEFDTGDAELDDLLETARNKYLDKDPSKRGEALEKLWDAFERLKTLEDPRDKKQSIEALIEKSAQAKEFGELLDDESHELTRIGNDFMIRHMEVEKIRVPSSDHETYLFHRLWALVRFLLQSTNRLA